AVGDVIFVDRHLKWTNRVSRAGFGLVGLLVVYLIPTLLPVPTIPLPTGGIPVGTISVEVIDPEREDAYGPAPAEARRLMVQVWYPAINTSGQSPVLWSEDWDVVAPALSRRIGFPSWFLGHTR